MVSVATRVSKATVTWLTPVVGKATKEPSISSSASRLMEPDAVKAIASIGWGLCRTSLTNCVPL